MIRAFSTLGANSDDSATALAHDISVAMYTTMIGLGLGLVGAILILVALLSSKNREPWFFSWSVSLSVFWSLVFFPYGVIVGGQSRFSSSEGGLSLNDGEKHNKSVQDDTFRSGSLFLNSEF